MTYQFNENIQRAIIYFMKSDKDFYLQIVNLVKPEYFEFPSHTKIFNTVVSYYDKYHELPSDLFILEDLKKTINARENISDYQDELDYVNNLDTSCISNPDYVVDLIESFAKKEAMKSAIAESITLIKEDKVEEVESIVRKALMVARTVDTGQNYFDDFSDRWTRTLSKDKDTKKFRTVFPSIDKSLDGGLGSKELAMVVAPPGVGKSLYLVNQGVQSLIDGNNVLYISLEMSEDKIAQRFDSIMSLVPQQKLKDPKHQLTVKERLNIFQSTFKGRLIIKEYPTLMASVNNIRSLLVQLKSYQEFVPQVIIIDYLELLRSTREIQHEYQAQQRIAEELRGLSMEQNVLVWTATQTNRQGRTKAIITDVELGDSYGKIRPCDFSMSLNQTEEEFDNGIMRVYIMKSRNGVPRFQVPAKVDYSVLRMTESTDRLEASND
jgi:replicative DNA helicase